MAKSIFDTRFDQPVETLFECKGVLDFINEAMARPRDDAGQLSPITLSGSALSGLNHLLDYVSSRLDGTAGIIMVAAEASQEEGQKSGTCRLP